MKLIKAYLKGLKNGAFNLKITFIIYAINLLIALLLALPFFKLLGDSAGKTMAIATLFKNFNYSVIYELISGYKGGFSLIFNEVFWFAGFYLFFSVFFAGGVFTYLYKEDKIITLGDFFQACGLYFWRFLRLALVMILVQVVIALIIYIPMGMIGEAIKAKAISEVTMVWFYGCVVTLHLIIFWWFLMVADYAKIIMMIDGGTNVYQSLLKSFRFVFKHIIQSYLLFLMLMVTPVGLFILYVLFYKVFGMTTLVTMLLIFLIEQAFIIARVFSKIWILGSQLYYYSYYQIPGTE